MKSFESSMASKLEQYLSYRTTLGYTNRVPRVAFYAFDHYLTKNKIDKHELFQPSFFLEFRKNMNRHHGKSGDEISSA